MVGERRKTYDTMTTEGYATITKNTRRGRSRKTHYIGLAGIEYAMDLFFDQLNVRAITIYDGNRTITEEHTK